MKGFFNLKVTRYPKNVYKIMANVKLLFCGSEKTNTIDRNIECFHNQFDEITINVKCDVSGSFLSVSLDKETAIKLSKELRKQIALITGVPF